MGNLVKDRPAQHSGNKLDSNMLLFKLITAKEEREKMAC